VADDNKTEQATPRRRHQAREKGQVARSRELIGIAATAGTLGVIAVSAGRFVHDWRLLFRVALNDGALSEWNFQNFSLIAPAANLGKQTVLALGMGWILAGIAALAQGGFVMAPGCLAPKAERMSPAAKLRQLFSVVAIGNSLKALLPAAAITYIAVSVLGRDWEPLTRLSGRTPIGVAAFAFARLFEVAWKSTLVLVAWSGADYLFQRFRFEHGLRMSRQELMDELKETEGNPAIKARIRRLQRQVRRRRMLKDTERATVVITNPSHYAVALEYRPEMGAPLVVAKGRNLLALEIKQIARWHGIPLVENPPLAHALYRAVEVGQSIPLKLYAVVAEVLAFVYRTQAQVRRRA